MTKVVVFDWLIGAFYILAAGAAAWWMEKGTPPKDVMRSYSFSTHLLSMMPFTTITRIGIAADHAEGFEAYRRRTWIAIAIFLGFGQLTTAYYWWRFA